MTKRMLPDPDNPGQLAEASVVDIIKTEEPFSYIELKDGTRLTMRYVAVEAVRFIDRWDANGNPIYNINTQANMTVSVPDEMKNKGNNDAK